MYLIQKDNDTRLDRAYWGSSFNQRLETGELWEHLVLLELRKLGLTARRPEQRFKKRKHYTQHQRDLLVSIGQVKRLNLEVKSRRNPFSYPSVLVGDCSSFDAKLFKVAAIVVVDTVTGDCRVAPGDSSEWLRLKLGANKLSYSIPVGLFCPLDAFADAVKDGLYNS